MPPYTLTSAEKTALRRKYLANIQAINRFLPADKQIQPNLKAFNAKLNDPSEQRFYKKGLEISERIKKQDQIASDLSKKIKATELNDKEYPLERSIYTRMIPSDDPRAMKYNRYIIEQYHKNPDALVQEKFQKLLQFNPGDLQKFADSKDIKNYLLDFYERNQEVIDDGFQMNKILGKDKSKLNPMLAQHLSAISGNYEMLTVASQATKLVNDDSYFTMPELDEDTISAIEDSNMTMQNEELYRSVLNKQKEKDIYEASLGEFHKAMDGLNLGGVDLDEKGALAKTIATIDQNGQKKVPISPVNKFCGNRLSQGDNFELQRFNQRAIDDINKVFKKDYIKESNFKLKEMPKGWNVDDRATTFRKELVYRYSLNNGLDISKVDSMKLGDIAGNIKGNLKEQILGTTSKQYKTFIQAMKNYENPKSYGYKDQEEVYKAANEYLIHKGVSSLADIEKLPWPGKDRAKLCWDVMDSYEKHMDPTEFKYMRGQDGLIDPKQTVEQRKQAIFTSKDVSVDPLGEIVIKEEPANIKDVNNKITKNDAKDFLEDDDDIKDMMDDIGDINL